MAHIVAGKFHWQWSPEQIAGWLKRTYPGDQTFQVPHETIYRSLFVQARDALKKELLGHLRRTRIMRRSRHHTQKTDNLGRIIGAVSISERPATAEDRASQIIGKVTFCVEAATARLRPSSNAIRAM